MMKYRLKFLTKKGEQAYNKVEQAGKKESFINKRIVNKVYSETVESKNPLVILIELKIVRLAPLINLAEQIEQALGNYGAVNLVDYVIEEVA